MNYDDFIKHAAKPVQQKTDNLFHQLLNTPIPIAVLSGPAYCFRQVNAHFLKLTGNDILFGKTLKDVFPSLGDEFISRLGNGYFNNETSVSVNQVPVKIWPHIETIAQERFLNLVFQLYYHESHGTIEHIVIFASDVTAEVITRRNLELANQEITRLFNTVNEGFFSRSILKSEYLHLSAGCEKIYGYSLEEIRSNVTLWYDVIHPEDKVIADHDDILLNEGKQTISEYRIIHKDQKIRWIELKIVPVILNGTLVRVEGIVNDVTERKKAALKLQKNKEMLSQILNSIPQAIFWKDRNGIYKGCNELFAKISGLAETSMIVGKNDHDLPWQEGYAAGYSAGDTDVIETGIARIHDLISRKGAEGETIFMDVTRIPLTDSQSRVYGLLGIYEDITERKRKEEEREKITQDLIQRNVDLKQFSYIVSHNLRSPITKIQGLASLFEKEDERNDLNNELIQHIRDEANNLDMVVKDINTIVFNQNPGLKIKEEIFFSDMLRLITKSIENEIHETGALITSDFSSSPSVFSIRPYFYSIMYNLISNAIKYRSSQRKPQIHLSSTSDNQHIIMTVADNGMGIDLDKYGSKLFCLYQRFHPDSASGKGMGLNLVKTQTESLGGKIELKSKPDDGSTFNVFFPNN